MDSYDYLQIMYASVIKLKIELRLHTFIYMNVNFRHPEEGVYIYSMSL